MSDVLEIPNDLLLPTDDTVRLPDVSDVGRFLVTPDQMIKQLLYGVHNPGYGHAAPDDAIEHLIAWRNNVIETDKSLKNGDPSFHGSHLTNSVARIALSPLSMRSQTMSLKDTFRQEEMHFPRQRIGRDPSELAILHHSLTLLLLSKK